MLAADESDERSPCPALSALPPAKKDGDVEGDEDDHDGEDDDNEDDDNEDDDSEDDDDEQAEKEPAALEPPQATGVGERSGGESSVNTNDQTRTVSIEMRVRLTPPSVPKATGGMVAYVGALAHEVGTDSGEWVSLSKDDFSQCASAEITPPKGSIVAALTFDCANKQVTGMLFAEAEEKVMNGIMNAYLAHIRKPVERDERLRERTSTRYAVQSFAIGDILQQLNRSPPAVATVARVLYSRRATQQARRLLILLELHPEEKYALPAKKIFFPGSWANWTRKTESAPSASSVQTNNDYMTLSKQDIRDLNKVL